MIYRTFQTLKLSALGFGGARLPVVEGRDKEVDQEETQRLVDYALAHGINYFDTAWGYHGGAGELAIGRTLKRHPRDSFYLADKFPGYDLPNMPRVREIFPEQLRKCQVDYFDFYLIHNVCEAAIDAYLDPRYGVMDYLLEQKAAGRIRHLGFSAHGSVPVIQRFLEAYGAHMEFCQIQLNWLDWELQDARGKTDLLRRLGLPIWVMEPVRGGRLATLDGDAEAQLRRLRPQEGIPAWSFRFLQSIPEVCVTLSGMSTMEQLQDNLRTFEEDRPLDQGEWDALLSIARRMTGGVPCTACHYCTSHCPQELDIPTLLMLYNDLVFSQGGLLVPRAVAALPPEKRPAACVGCGSCAAVCPQQIHIPQALADFARRLEG